VRRRKKQVKREHSDHVDQAAARRFTVQARYGISGLFPVATGPAGCGITCGAGADQYIYPSDSIK
jgi:hypothetical protein